MQFKTTDLPELKVIRENYFKTIQLSQELFIEWIVTKGKYYKIIQDREIIGYVIISEENILVEFHVIVEYVAKKEEIFLQVLNQFSIKKAYCKSFDSLLLTCCLTYSKSSGIIGTIFREYTNTTSCDWDNSLFVRIAEEKEIPFLLTFDSELYESPEELDYMVRNKMVYLFEKGEQLIGCGYLIKILPDKNFYDIGMWTNPDFREQGYATKIIAYLKKYCFQNNYIPVCGCAVDNIASRKVLERNGFISRHCIVEFDFKSKQ